ncbi:HlyD family efflux transporter periplasmic adaptor subunit [Orrella sp. NBD-18]|uniref:HlyD family efflux transporter periplasmic adaptor subunit n=1 Tax=Sheuella amnicola TaxID=2707330 RepID=A0A6B2R272_9BURK|nr:HlyD family efflux transporter periplasmic adaptor subunit [Sheuella amnicola]NDY83734.1 HlyD family efflux transporter periplasmic adaptor subunit [Sheuella amnicola]HBI83061.1 hemolysin secretion protein D [Alcaligenaceae bacterium]
MARFNHRMSFKSVEDDERRAGRHLIWAVGLTLLIALIWASNFHLDEITKGQGKVIPSSREQVIQSLDAGILAEMYVHEGDSVEKDQILLRIDDNRSGPVYREAREKWLALSAQAARLRAESYGTELVFPEEIKEFPQIVDRETQAYKARKQAVNEHIAAMERSLAALTREISLTAPLVNEGVVSEVELLRLKRQQADLMGQIVERRNRYLTDANNELIRVEAELSQTKENALAREDAYKRTVIRSPMKGVVKNVQVNTIGGVIQAGQNILEIVPVDDEMLVEAYVKPSEVAFLKVGQAAVVKLTAYDFNKYGGLDGVLEHLSPDTLKDENKVKKPGANQADLEEGYYRILVRILNSKVERAGRVLEPLPGMTATVDIRTGEKTVLEYLFRPLQSVSQALRER